MISSRKVKRQGNEAEHQVSALLHSLGNEYVVFDNVMLKTKKGTTQIDHVVISPYGIFVIETKSHKGEIFGDCDSKNWTQVLFSKKGVLTYSFYSPYLQNYGHLRNLYRVLDLPYTFFLGIICFTSESVNLNNVICENAIYFVNLAPEIYSHRNVLLTDEQVIYLCNRLRNNNVQSRYYDRKHVKYVKSM